MCKFKAKSGLKHYIKYRLIKWGFKCWYRCEINTGYFYQLHLYRNAKPQLNSISVKVLWWNFGRICEITTATCSSTTISTAQQLFKSYMSRDYMDAILSNLGENICAKQSENKMRTKQNNSLCLGNISREFSGNNIDQKRIKWMCCEYQQ